MGGGGEGVWRWGKREIIYLSLHWHHQNDPYIKMDSDERQFNVSLTVKDKVTRQCQQTTIFEEKGEPKRNRTEVPLLTSLMPILLTLASSPLFPFKCLPRLSALCVCLSRPMSHLSTASGVKPGSPNRYCIQTHRFRLVLLSLHRDSWGKNTKKEGGGGGRIKKI